MLSSGTKDHKILHLKAGFRIDLGLIYIRLITIELHPLLDSVPHRNWK